jgi:hypothetical protein
MSETFEIHSNFTLNEMCKCNYQKSLSKFNYKLAFSDLSRLLVFTRTPLLCFLKEKHPIKDSFRISVYEDAQIRKVLKAARLGHEIVNEKKKEVTAYDVFLWKKGDDFANNSICHERIMFVSEIKGDFSIFQGYQYKVLKQCNVDKIKHFLNHVKEVICNNEEEPYKYLICWIAFSLQFPEKKTGTAPLLIGEQGVGKNTFFTDIICELFGIYAEDNVTNMDHIVGEFNPICENKKLIIGNELQSVDVAKFLNSDKLKSVLTDLMMLINQKNQAIRNVQNLANFIFVSNNNRPLKIETGDRRYLVLNC